jgi:hypothetical protein
LKEADHRAQGRVPCLPSGTVAGKSDMPLWFTEEPHWRLAEWTALKIWLAVKILQISKVLI